VGVTFLASKSQQTAI